jgi:hypothetical protein
MRIFIDTLGSSSIFQRFAFIYAPECGEISEHGYHIHMAETWRLRNTNDKFKDNGITASIGANTGWKGKHILLAGHSWLRKEPMSIMKLSWARSLEMVV